MSGVSPMQSAASPNLANSKSNQLQLASRRQFGIAFRLQLRQKWLTRINYAAAETELT